MNIVVNEKKIKRNTKLAQYLTIGGIGSLGIGLWVSWTTGSDPAMMEQYIWVMYASMLLGFILTQIGLHFTNRFGRKPRFDEQVSAAFKGLGKDYTLYHYITPVSHLLVGPAGVWILETYYQRGTIVYEKGRWKQKGGGPLQGYLRIFAQEGLGRPDIEIAADIEGIKKLLEKELGEPIPPINAALLFVDPRVALAIEEEAPHPALRLDDVKDYLKKYAKTNPMPLEQVKRITAIFPQESIE